jgi:hypothetical protein
VDVAVEQGCRHPVRVLEGYIDTIQRYLRASQPAIEDHWERQRLGNGLRKR